MKRLMMTIPESIYVLGQQLDPLERKMPYSFLRDLLIKAVYEERDAQRQQKKVEKPAPQSTEPPPAPVRKGVLVVAITKETSNSPNEFFISEQKFNMCERENQKTIVMIRFSKGGKEYGQMRWDDVTNFLYDSDKPDPKTGNPFYCIQISDIQEHAKR